MPASDADACVLLQLFLMVDFGRCCCGGVVFWRGLPKGRGCNQ